VAWSEQRYGLAAERSWEFVLLRSLVVLSVPEQLQVSPQAVQSALEATCGARAKT
jgi:hypothetical protein